MLFLFAGCHTYGTTAAAIYFSKQLSSEINFSKNLNLCVLVSCDVVDGYPTGIEMEDFMNSNENCRKFLASKTSNSSDCEDGIFISSNFIAVIDGVTSNSAIKLLVIVWCYSEKYNPRGPCRIARYI